MSENDPRVARATSAATAALLTVLGAQRWPERCLYMAAGALVAWGFRGSAWQGAGAFILLALGFAGVVGWSVIMYGAGSAAVYRESERLKASMVQCSGVAHVANPGGGGCVCGHYTGSIPGPTKGGLH